MGAHRMSNKGKMHAGKGKDPCAGRCEDMSAKMGSGKMKAAPTLPADKRMEMDRKGK